jgi:thioester reductase-like protein
MFTILFKSRPDILKIIKERVIAIQGDLVMEELGMSREDRAMLIDDLDLIINSAASIDF